MLLLGEVIGAKAGKSSVDQSFITISTLGKNSVSLYHQLVENSLVAHGLCEHQYLWYLNKMDIIIYLKEKDTRFASARRTLDESNITTKSSCKGISLCSIQNDLIFDMCKKLFIC